jgi:hypothetical protein
VGSDEKFGSNAISNGEEIGGAGKRAEASSAPTNAEEKAAARTRTSSSFPALEVARYNFALAVGAGTEIHLHERLLLLG